MKRAATTIALMLGMCLAASLAAGRTFAATRDVCPTCPYHSITEALNVAVAGDTIRVVGGSAYGAEELSLILSTNGALSVVGGYSADFSSRDPAANPTIVARIGVGGSNTSTYLVDGFKVVDAQNSGIYIQSTLSTITIQNCIVENAGYIGIQAPFFATLNLLNNIVDSSAWNFGIEIGWDSSYTRATVAGNMVRGHTCGECVGIDLTHAKALDVVRDNIVYNNRTGIKLTSDDFTPTPQVSGNRVYGNTGVGIYLQKGSPSVRNNAVYANDLAGIEYYVYGTPDFQASGQLVGNLLADNGDTGMRILGGYGTPRVVDNIFYHNGQGGLEFGPSSGWGSTSIAPTAMKHNFFSHNLNGPAMSHSGLPPSYSFSSEVPGSYGDLNSAAWSDGNVVIDDPGFVDAAGHDYRLAVSSFLIDEGLSTEDAGSEPAPNGGLVNAGAEGGTADATTSPLTLSVSNVTAAQDGSALVVSFDTSTETDYLWVSVDYFDGESYTEIAPAKLSGTGYEVGYKAGRIVAGPGQSLRYESAGFELLGRLDADAKLRVRLAHGARTASAESTSFQADFTSPSVSIVAPGAGSVFSTMPIYLAAEAYPSEGDITGVTFSYKRSDGAVWSDISTDTTAPYEADWSGVTLTTGVSYDLRATAHQSNGKSASRITTNVHLCSLTLSPDSIHVDRSAQTVEVNFTASDPMCSWQATGNADWFWYNPNSGMPDATFSLMLQANNGQNSRSSSVSINGITLPIFQDGLAAPTAVPSATAAPTLTPTVTGTVPADPIDPSASPVPTMTPTATATTNPAQSPATPPAVETPATDTPLPLQADLKAGKSQLSRRSGKLTATLTCANTGNAAAAAHSNAIYLSSGRSVSRTSHVLKRISVSSLAAGATATARVSATARQMRGYRYLIMSCDATRRVGESNETNNLLSVKY